MGWYQVTNPRDLEEGVAVFSSDRKYRYALTRSWDPKLGTAVFIGLNPSTADESTLDPTLRRCVRFAMDWGYGKFIMTNIFAFRATNPQDMRTQQNPIGVMNDFYIMKNVRRADLVIACWGAHGRHLNRGALVRSMIEEEGIAICHLGLTMGGHPVHPLYLPRDRTPSHYWA